jgi:type IV pilus assembly protein PilM
MGKPHAFLAFFPPPTYLTMPAVGIDISDRTMKFVELSRTSDGLVPTRFGDRPLEEGIIADGKILDGKRLEAALTALRREFKFAFVRASLPEQQAYVFQIEAPLVKDEEQLIQTIEFKLEENIPLSPGEVILGYDVLGVKKSADNLDVTVTAYPRENAQRYIEALEGAGLMPLSLEIESQAIARSVISEGDTDTYLIVDFGETRTGIAIVSRGLLAFTSTVDVRGRDLTEAIMKGCDAEGSEVARIKNEVGIRRSSGEHQELSESLSRVVSSLTDELERHHTYWNTNAQKEVHDRIKKVLLCGGNANLAGLSEYVASRLRVPTERANVWVNAFSFDRKVPSIPLEASLSYATAIGLALHRNE